MPTFTITIEDTSPLLIFSATGSGGSTKSDWQAGTSHDDAYADQYSEGTYMVTPVIKANLSFAIYGNGVQIFGSKRPNHGTYFVNIDSIQYPPVSGTGTSPGTFQTSLFTAIALNTIHHTVTLVNNEAAFLDIDFLTYQTPIGLDNEVLLVSTAQDSEPSFAYSSSSEWDTNPANIGTFSGGSGHKLGDLVALFGPVGPNGAPYSAQLDKGTLKIYSASYPVYRPQNIIFVAHNLGSGEHTVRITCLATANSALTLAIDYAQVFTTPSLGGIQSASIPMLMGTSSQPNTSSSQLAQSPHKPAGAIAGIGILATLILILIGFGFFHFRNKWATQRASNNKVGTPNGPESEQSAQELLPIQPGPASNY